MFNKVLIYKENIINNIKQIKHENPNSKICAMVKANAYGVGAKQVVEILNDYADFFGVANFCEAKEIALHTTKQILIVGTTEKQVFKEEISTCFSYMCGDLEDLEFLISLKMPIKIHLKINTGMNRFGINSIKEFKNALKLIAHSSLIFEGLFTHFATTDEKVNSQMEEFKKYVNLTNKFGYFPIIHADNSFVNEKFNHGLDMVRIGFNLYNRDEGWFLPAVEIKSEVVQTIEIKKGESVGYNNRFIAKQKMEIAVIPMGYADGFDMKYIGLDLIIKNTPCKILNVCMDCFMLDISAVDIKKGDEIYILNKFNPLKKYANQIKTHEYEIMCKFSHVRAERILT